MEIATSGRSPDRSYSSSMRSGPVAAVRVRFSVSRWRSAASTRDCMEIIPA